MLIGDESFTRRGCGAAGRPLRPARPPKVGASSERRRCGRHADRRRRPRSRNGAPAATDTPWASSARTAASSSGTGTQTFSPLRPWRGEPVRGQRVDERACGGPCRRRRPDGRPPATSSSAHSRAVSRWRMPLTQPGPEGQPALDARERELIAGEDRAAQVRAEPLGDRAHDRPPAARARRRVVRHAGDRAEVVVLDHEHVREQRAQRRGALGVQRRAERVVPARRDDRPARSGVQRGGQRLGPHPAVVDRDRREPQPERPRQVEHARPARVLDGQQVAGGELRREHALDPVERPADDHDPLRRPRRPATKRRPAPGQRARGHR